MGSWRVGHDWATSLSLFTFIHWRRKWQPIPGFLPGESQGWGTGGLPSMGSHRVRHDWRDSSRSKAPNYSLSITGLTIAMLRRLKIKVIFIFFLKWSLKWLILQYICSVTSVQFSRSVVSNYLWPNESQHARPPCPTPTPGVHSKSCPLSRWCHPVISSSVIPFSSCPQSIPASASFPMSQFFAWAG